jgi:hypothetical protein
MNPWCSNSATAPAAPARSPLLVIARTPDVLADLLGSVCVARARPRIPAQWNQLPSIGVGSVVAGWQVQSITPARVGRLFGRPT